MTANDSECKDSIAQELGWDSYDAAPHIVRNNIDAKIEGPNVENPFDFLRRDA